MKTKLLIISLVLCGITNAQEDNTFKLKKNAIYAEIGGNGMLYSLNYERQIYQKNKFHFAASIGGMAFPELFNPGIIVIIPLEAKILLGKKKNFFETGLGNSFNTATYNSFQFNSSGNPKDFYYKSHYAFLRIGYRYQNPNGGFLFRIAALPYLNYKPGFIASYPNEPNFGIEGSERKNEIGFWAGASFGFTF